MLTGMRVYMLVSAVPHLSFALSLFLVSLLWLPMYPPPFSAEGEEVKGEWIDGKSEGNNRTTYPFSSFVVVMMMLMRKGA